MSLILSAKGVKAIDIPDLPSIATGTSSPQTAQAIFDNDGSLILTPNTAKWYSFITAGIGNDYELYATVISGTGFTGTFDAWQALSATLTFELSVASGAANGVIEFSIRRVGETVNMEVQQITFDSEVVV